MRTPPPHFPWIFASLSLLGLEPALAQTIPQEASSESVDTATASLVPPELVEFVSAQYPEQALAEQLTAQVMLEVHIDATGKVTTAKVLEPAGHGFDEAAEQAVRSFLFRPAQKDGQPIAARILYRYDFTLSDQPAPVADTEPALPPPSVLRGRLETTLTKEPLPNAKITLRLADGTEQTLTTDATGNFEFALSSAGPVKVLIEADGHQPYRVTETVKSGELLEAVYRVQALPSEYEVTVLGEREEREVTRRTLERDKLALIPGTGGDALAAIQTLPGVARSPGFSGMIISRGSGPQGTATLVDGLYVPQIYHFGGLTSIVPTEMIESIDFFPGNFGAKYGRVAGGFIDVKLRELEDDGQYHGLAQVDLIDGRLMLRGPVPYLKDWNFVVAARRSHLDAWLTPLLEDGVGVRTAPVYYDWQGFVETRPSPKTLVRLGAFGSQDRLSLIMKDADADDPGFANSLSSKAGMTHFSALVKSELSRVTRLQANASVGRDFERFAVGSLLIDQKYVPVVARAELTTEFGKALTLRAGPDFIYYYIDAEIRAPQPPREGVPEPGPYSTQPMLHFDDALHLYGPAVYAELEARPVERLTLLFGHRLDYYNLVDELTYSPRLNARVELTRGRYRTTLKAGAGRYYEMPDVAQLVDVFGTPGLKWNRSEHYTVGFEQTFTEHVELSVDAFYKDLSDFAINVARPDGSTGFANLGEGEVVGLETLLRLKPSEHFFGWVAYTWSRSTRTDGPGAEERLFEYDQPHNLTVVASSKLGRGWQLGGRFRYVSGNPTTPCVGGIVQASAGTYTCQSGDTFSERLPAFHQLDLRVDKTFTFTSWKLTSYLDVQNVTNRGNPEGISYNYDYTKQKYATGLPIIPSLGLRGEF